jgi:negative modulator of initiation of replication
MIKLSVEDYIWNHLERLIRETGKSPSQIIAEALQIKDPAPASRGLSNHRDESPIARAFQEKLRNIRSPSNQHELSEALTSPKFTALRSAVDRFLYILGVAHEQKPADFPKLLEYQGRDRLYFATDSKAIEASGTSTQPRQIPDSRFWVMTNSPNSQKAAMLYKALAMLDYSDAAIRSAVSGIQLSRSSIYDN